MSPYNVNTAALESKETSGIENHATRDRHSHHENNRAVSPDINPAFQGTEVIPSVAIDRIIALRQEALSTYLQGVEMLMDARKMMRQAAGASYLCGFEQGITDALGWTEHPERIQMAIKKLIDGKIWDRLLSDTGMYTLMSAKQRGEWDKQLHGSDMPEVTLDNVLATFRALNANKADTFEKGIIDVFRSLSWDYKTNNPCKLGKRIIITGLLDTRYSGFITVSTRGRHNWMIWRARFTCLKSAMCRISAFLKARHSTDFIVSIAFPGRRMKGSFSVSVISKKARPTSPLKNPILWKS